MKSSFMQILLSDSIQITDKAEKMGLNLTKIPFKDSFWKGTTRTRPRECVLLFHAEYCRKLFLFLESELV